jgi:hypothetical protein
MQTAVLTIGLIIARNYVGGHPQPFYLTSESAAVLMNSGKIVVLDA